MQPQRCELRILGPQFSDPGLFAGWLARRFGAAFSPYEIVAPMDFAFESTFAIDPALTVHVMAARIPYMNPGPAYQRLLRDADAVVILLNRTADLVRLNERELDEMRAVLDDRLSTLPGVVAVNNPYCDDSRPMADLATATAALHGEPWKVIETRIGSFNPAPRCEEGAEDVLREALDRYRERTS